MSAASAVMQLEALIKQASSLAQTFGEGKMRPTTDQYSSLEDLSAKLSEVAAKVAENINVSARAHRTQTFQEAQKLLSVARADGEALFRTGQPKNLATFKRNISLIFEGPSESSLDSGANKRRKILTKQRCERLSSLNPDSVLLWSNALTPTMWTANEMSRDVFNCLANQMENERVIQNWPSELSTTMHVLGKEGQLRTSDKYRDFLTASEARKRTGSQNPEGMQQEAGSSSALTQLEQLTADETNPTKGSGQSNPPSIKGMSKLTHDSALDD